MNFKNLQQKKIGFVLSGGVVRAAAWHLGVALALEELGLNFKPIENKTSVSTFVGSSAGALVSIFLATGHSPQDIINVIFGENPLLKPITYKDMFYLKRPNIKTKAGKYYNQLQDLPTILQHLLRPFFKISGFFSTEGLRQYLLKNFIQDDSFESLLVDLFIVATQLDHSRKVIFGKYNYPNTKHDSTAVYYTGFPISQVAAASMSIPPFYSPYPIYNPVTKQVDYYIDGEIRETLSHHVAIDNGCDLIINSWTHSPYHFHDEIGSLVHYGIPGILVQTFTLMMQKKIVTERSHNMTAKDVMDTIFDYMHKEKLTSKQIKEVMSILERKLHFKRDVEIIDIFPDNSDYELFFTSLFSLDKKKLGKVVQSGYKKTMRILA